MGRNKNYGMRNRIIKLAFSVFVENGYDETSLAEIADKAGISKSLLQKYFPKKDDLLIGILMFVNSSGRAFLMKKYPSLFESDEDLFFSVYERMAFLCYSKCMPKLLGSTINDMNLITRSMKQSVDSMEFDDPQARKEWLDRYLKPVYSFEGTMAIFTSAALHGDIDITVEECIDMALKHYYLDVGLDHNDQERLLSLSHEMASEAIVGEFFDYVERKARAGAD